MQGHCFASADTLVLRHLDPADLAPFVAYRTDPDVARFQSWERMDETAARAFLEGSARVESPFRAGLWTQIAVAEPNGALMGDMGLHLSQDGRVAELGITLAPAYHRHGHATTAMRLAMGLARAYPGIERLIAGADRRNTASLRLLHKLGFRWTHDEKTSSDPDAVDALYELPLGR